jgi:hypothetical protein
VIFFFLNYYKQESGPSKGRKRQNTRRTGSKRGTAEIGNVNAMMQAEGSSPGSATTVSAPDPNAWRFSCLCGERATSTDPPFQHPKDSLRKFECSQCQTWGHVDCYPNYKVCFVFFF